MPQLNPEFFVSQLFWLVVTFSFLFVFLWRVSLPRIGNVLEKRERKISEDLTAAKELQAEASQIQEEIEKQLKQARTDASEIIKSSSIALQDKAQTELNPNQILRLITTSLNDDKAENILTIPLQGKSAMADYMVVASGASSRQVAAMAEHLEFKLKQEKVDILGLEGLRQADWVLLDANDVIVHIFRPEVRDFYGLERMWVDDMSAEIVKVGSDA